MQYPYVDEPGIDAYDSQEWTELFAKTAVARALFAQAAGIDTCRFANDGASGDLARDRAVAFGTMRDFVTAHGWRNIKKQPEATLTDCGTLLAHARHLDAQGKVFASMYSMVFADSAFTLCEATLEHHGGAALQRELLERMLEAFERHRRTRATLAQLADATVADARYMIDSTIAEAVKNTPALKQAKDRAIEMITELAAPMRSAKPGDLDKVRKAYKQAVEQLKAKHDRKRIDKVLENGTGEALASVLALLLATDTSGLMGNWIEHDKALVKIEAKVKARLAALPAKKQRRSPAPAAYRQAVRDLRTELRGDRASVRLPRGESPGSQAWRDAVAASVATRAGFFAATRIPDCRWWLVGDKRFYELYHLAAELELVRRLCVVAAIQESNQRPQAAAETAEALARFARHARACPSGTGLHSAWQAEAEALELLHRTLPRTANRDATRHAGASQKLARQMRRQRIELEAGLGVLLRDCQRRCKIDGDAYQDDLAGVPDRACELLTLLLRAQPGDETAAGLEKRIAPVLERWRLLAGQRDAADLPKADRIECHACHLAHLWRPQFERLLPAYRRLLRAERALAQLLEQRLARDDAMPLYQLAAAEWSREARTFSGRYPRTETWSSRASDPTTERIAFQCFPKATAHFAQTRSMFALAAARSSCRNAELTSDQRTALRFARNLVIAHATEHLESDPKQCVASLCVLLQHGRHLDAFADDSDSSCSRQDYTRYLLVVAERAVRNVRTPADREGLRPLRRELQAFVDRAANHNLAEITRAELDEQLQRHQPRLRDVFQTSEQGYQPEVFRAATLRLLGRLAAIDDPLDAVAWLELHEKLEQQLLKQPEGADALQLSTRGMAMLVLAGSSKEGKAAAANRSTANAVIEKIDAALK